MYVLFVPKTGCQISEKFHAVRLQHADLFLHFVYMVAPNCIILNNQIKILKIDLFHMYCPPPPPPLGGVRHPICMISLHIRST